MVSLFDSSTIEAVADGSTPITSNGGPFSSVVETNGTVRVSTDQAVTGTKSIRFTSTGTGTAFSAVVTSVTVPSNYETIYVSFSLYIDTMLSTSTVCNLVFLSARYCVYLFYSSGWKVGHTPVHNTTSAKVGSEATSAALTPGQWYTITAVYHKISASNVNFRLIVNGVETSTGSQAPANFTVVSGAAAYRVGPASQLGFEVASANGDIFYIDNLNIAAFPAPAPQNPNAIRRGAGKTEVIGVGGLYVG